MCVFAYVSDKRSNWWCQKYFILCKCFLVNWQEWMFTCFCFIFFFSSCSDKQLAEASSSWSSVSAEPSRKKQLTGCRRRRRRSPPPYHYSRDKQEAQGFDFLSQRKMRWLGEKTERLLLIGAGSCRTGGADWSFRTNQGEQPAENRDPPTPSPRTHPPLRVFNRPCK